jgi:hypothetical protein
MPDAFHLCILPERLYAVGASEMHRRFFGQKSDPGAQFRRRVAPGTGIIHEIAVQRQFGSTFI